MKLKVLVYVWPDQNCFKPKAKEISQKLWQASGVEANVC